MAIEEAGEELGKSLSKILYSAKYEQFHADYTDLIQIISVASNTAIRIIEDDIRDDGA